MPVIFSEKKRHEISRQIKEAALRLFKTKGIRKTTVAELAESVGIAKGTFYNFYATKGQLVAEIMDDFDAASERELRNKIGGRDKLDKNTTIFGHSASNCDPDGVRFTKLYRYMDVDFVKEHPYIYLSVDGEDMIFQITALFVTDIGFDYIEPDPAGDDLTSFFETIARKNWLDFDGVTFSEEDTVLTLSTCCRKYDKANSGNQRLVVMAKLLPEGATAQEFSVSLVDSPEMP